MILRPYQKRAVEKTCKALDQHGDTLLVAPTGAGKAILIGAVNGKRGGKQLILQHRQELVQQNAIKFRRVNHNTRIGLFTADTKTWDGDATFAMVATLVIATTRR